jgi:hypothetical protein
MFIFLSPQFLVNHAGARDIFIQCSRCTTLGLIALDKMHIHIQHGMMFCSKIRALRVIFFAKIFGNEPPMNRPSMIALTATMLKSYLPLLSHLLTINSFVGDSLICSTPIEFFQCKIEMQSYITSSKD